MEKLFLNGFEVDPRLAELMIRKDWAMSRGRRQLFTKPHIPNSEAWLEKFQSAEKFTTTHGIFAIEFYGVEQAIHENRNIRNPELSILCGAKSDQFPPGDFDPTRGYIIGVTCEVDEGIFVDLRPQNGAIISYSNHSPEMTITTAFHSIESFVAFYVKQHGR